jgi:hypothetical protein
MKATLVILALATTVVLPTRISAQDEPPSVLKSVGVTAAEFGVGLGVSILGEAGFLTADGSVVKVSILSLTPVAAATGVFGTGAWLDPGGRWGSAVLGSYVGAVLGFSSGLAYGCLFRSSNGFNSDLEQYITAIGFPIGCAIGSVVGYKMSRRPAAEEDARWQLIPPSIGLAMKRPTSGRPMEIAGVRANLVGVRF